MEYQEVELRDAPAQFMRIKDAVVSLTWRRDFGSDIEHISSAFAFVVSGSWYLVTADHVVEDLLSRQDSGFVCISKNGDRLGHPIPFRVTDDNSVRLSTFATETLEIDKPEDPDYVELLQHLAELDIAAVWLESLYVDGLRMAGVQPFTRDDILDVGAPPAEDGFELFVAGFQESAFEKLEGGYSQVLQLLPIDLRGLDNRNRFVFGPEFNFGSVKGMSGGPVILNAANQVWLVGVQSSQYGIDGKTPSKLFVAPAHTFLNSLEIVEAERVRATLCE